MAWHTRLTRTLALQSTSRVQGLVHLTRLTRLEISLSWSSWASGTLLLGVVGQLTTLRSLHLPALADWPLHSPLSTLRCHLLSASKQRCL